MKGRFLTWEKFQNQNPKQTAIEVTYSSPSYPTLKSPFTRILLGDFESREEAWEWCKRENVRRKVVYRENQPIEISVRLIRLSKLIKDYAERHPKRVSGIKIVL